MTEAYPHPEPSRDPYDPPLDGTGAEPMGPVDSPKIQGLFPEKYDPGIPEPYPGGEYGNLDRLGFLWTGGLTYLEEHRWPPELPTPKGKNDLERLRTLAHRLILDIPEGDVGQQVEYDIREAEDNPDPIQGEQ